MTVLLEIREKIRQVYMKVDVLFIPFVRFLLALVLLNTINSRLGYMTRLNNMSIVLIVALLCSILPTGAMALFATIFSMLHLYSLSLEVAAVGLVVFLLIYLLYLRFAPRESWVVVLTPLLMCFRMPYVIPIVVGLLGAPASAASVASGLIAYYFLKIVIDNSATVTSMGTALDIEKFKLIIDNLLGNKEMLVMIVAFAITIIFVYLIRRLSIDYSWSIAIAAGVILNPVLLLVGDLVYSVDLNIGTMILGSLLAGIVGVAIMFFRFCVDYSRTERVQFEDDEYYYYVKAIPKMTLGASSNAVTRINQSHNKSRSRVQYVDGGNADDNYGSADGYYEEDYSYEEGYEENYESGYNQETPILGNNPFGMMDMEENEYPTNYTGANDMSFRNQINGNVHNSNASDLEELF